MKVLLAIGAALLTATSIHAWERLGGGPRIIAQDGNYLGRLNNNKYDPDSVANPYGRYGSRYSADSINNPYGKYGSPYSPYSATNPYSTQSPFLVGD